ncbi:hypothetical protein [Streptomyces acidiscabies]|uniref:Alkaline shock response membrane anchor protein AmaP n=1 Tax=Streptomyces acidiscabies TaxID=42234 RepID=A0AAP6EM82_9ACTN|nr:hypothetical protein [Streptomyces acidiscabies]MBP5942505.1 hypothetical protein [Streptomyces sp. LBUM 1476]MBZ3917741.1 hypothetical protein [Streptomyces acidiscabies]MDX2967146.1 hypothetical protein [Streptomyces acidiscabies]MDX3023545.1 hypothetical protein [Streptomyces acidiscabies]MDX3789249.1 hypothetical protein [Streptomyces acidiscabies]
MSRARTTVNRTVLAAAGLTMLLTGGWLTQTGGPLRERLPSWWPATGTDTVLLDRTRLAQLRAEDWWTPTVLATTIALTVLLVYGALAQLRSGPTRRLALPAPGSAVRTQALAEAMTTRAATVPGVARARARVLPRRRQRLDVGLRVWLHPGTPPHAVLPPLHAVITEAERATAPYTSYTRIRLSTLSRGKSRVR